MKTSSENVNGYMREVDELALFEVEPDEIPSTLTGFSKNSILVGRENEEICRLDKKMVLLKWMDHPYPRGNYNFSEISRNKIPGQKDSKQIAVTSACYRQ